MSAELSDDEFLNSAPPPPPSAEDVAAAEEAAQAAAQQDEADAAKAAADATVAATETTTEEQPAPATEHADPAKAEQPGKEKGTDTNTDGEHTSKEAPKDGTVSPKKVEGEKGEVKPDPAKPDAPAEGGAKTETAATPTDYKGFYEKIMAPFKANGKQIELRSPEEAIQLMQQGANFTRKMQELAPYRKMVLMLQNNGLMDEAKLSYLIDLDKKNPEAIKKLIKESGIDPLDIDTTAEPAYREGNHRVSDDEANFREALSDMNSDPVKQETLKVINTDWDQASKDYLWTNPSAMTAIHQQRELGVYDRVSGEVNRLRALGQIGPEISFLDAYRYLLNQMETSGQLKDLVPAAATQAAPKEQVPPKAPVAVRAAAPKPPVTDTRANAATPTRSTPKVAQEITNYFNLSDEEFLKQAPPNRY